MRKFSKMFIFSLAALCLGLTLPGGTARAAERMQPTGENIVIVIDPGHGGDNLGTEAGHTIEKEMTLVTAKSMFRELEQYDNVTVYLTHSGDQKMSLKERAEFAASVGADFLFSIHYNASLEHTMFGSEVWVSCELPYHSYGYQFGYEHLLAMREKGLFIRGVKTRIDKGTDYYGILRESSARSVPSVIIEHCYVDEERDADHIKNADDWAEFGRLDALSVAKYFGLKSSALGVDYSKNAGELQPVSTSALVDETIQDMTPPDVCLIELKNCDEDTGEVELTVSAADYDSMLFYYTYSLDGGQNWSEWEAWPECDALARTYRDTFQLKLQIPSGTQPDITLKAYNITDLGTQSNTIHFERPFTYGEGADEQEAGYSEENYADEAGRTGQLELPDHSRKSIGTTTFMPTDGEAVSESEKKIDVLDFLVICLILVILLFFTVLFTQMIGYRKRKKQRRNKR